MRNVLKQMKNPFSDLYFSSYGHFCPQNDSNFRWIFTHNSKSNNRKKLYLIPFYSVLSAPFMKIWAGSESTISRSNTGLRFWITVRCWTTVGFSISSVGKNPTIFLYAPSPTSPKVTKLDVWSQKMRDFSQLRMCRPPPSQF